MEPWKILIIIWLAGSAGFILGAAWCGFFRFKEGQPGPPEKMPTAPPPRKP